MMELYDRIVDKELLVRRVNVVAAGLIPEDKIPEEAPEQLDLFTDYETIEKKSWRLPPMTGKSGFREPRCTCRGNTGRMPC